MALTAPRKPDRSLELEEATGERTAVVRELYASLAPTQTGNLARKTEHFWRNALGLRGGPPHHVLVVHDRGQPVGYAIVDHGSQFGPLRAIDVRWSSPAAARRLWAALADQATMADGLVYAGAPQDALFHVVPDPRPRVEEYLDWMLRLVDVDRALTERGYPLGFEGRLELHVEDDFLPANAGDRVLSITKGEATVEPGGSGAIRLDVRDLTCLFSGFLTAHQLALTGTLRASSWDQARLDAAFAGPRPWMADRF
jgi:predicted acetyltransferase